MKQAIEKRLNELSTKLDNKGCKHDLNDLKFVICSEFKRTPYMQNSLNYFHFIENLNIDQLIHYLNCYEDMKVKQ
ncbi:hypothetical protein AABD41_01455 [Staphylococcus pseudoxylosus]|uniref:hypothetical protein n=1 Tax=Staphylococcus pseudoxylosus TaxID=2282419 RepID=UPI00398AEF4C